MNSIQQTLRKSREVDEKFKAFMAKKEQRDKSMQQTMKKIKQTQQTLANTKQTIKNIDSLYDSIEKRFSDAISSALKGVQKNMALNIADSDWKPNKINEKEFVRNLKQKKQILFLTGAGMGVASGIPTFRGANGFYDNNKLKNEMTQNVKTPQELLTLSHFKQHQFSTWKWLTNFYNIKSAAKLNKGHTALNTIMTEIIQANKKTLLVTQNIDDFHLQAQKSNKQKNKTSKEYKICQIHGNIKKIRCDSCSSIKKQIQFYDFKDYIKKIQSKQSPSCPKCNEKLRPHIMFFDEFYDQLYNQVQTIKKFMIQSDLLIVIGTALQTGLAMEIVQNSLQRKIQIMEINIEPQIKRPNVMWVDGKADQILDKIKYELWKTGL